MSEPSISPDAVHIQLGQLNTKIEQLQEQLKTQAIDIAELQDRIPDSNIISQSSLSMKGSLPCKYF